jgi:outer membrane autotransporter protein
MSSNAVQKSLDVVGTRASELRAGIDNSVSGMAAGNSVHDKGIWAQAFGTTSTQDTRNGVIGYDADTGGAAVGADMIVADHTRAGLSVSYARTNVDANGVNQSTDIDTYQGNLYAFHDMGQWYADGTLGFAWQKYNSDRFISAPSSTANGDYDGQTYTVRANTGYRYNASNGFQIIPNGGLTYINNRISGYTETGAGGLNLQVSDYNSQALFGRVGFDVAKDFANNGMVIRPVIRAAYLYDFIGDEASTNALFTGGGAAFRVSDASPARSSFNVGASLNLITTKNVTLSADYDYLTKQDYDSHSGMLRARFGF